MRNVFQLGYSERDANNGNKASKLKKALYTLPWISTAESLLLSNSYIQMSFLKKHMVPLLIAAIILLSALCFLQVLNQHSVWSKTFPKEEHWKTFVFPNVNTRQGAVSF